MDEKKKETMPVLFIGGPKDGERIEMEDLPRVAMFPHKQLTKNFAEQIGHTAEIVELVYRREAFRSPAGLYPVYVFETIPPEDVIHTLLEGYRQPAKENTNVTTH